MMVALGLRPREAVKGLLLTSTTTRFSRFARVVAMSGLLPVGIVCEVHSAYERGEVEGGLVCRQVLIAAE